MVHMAVANGDVISLYDGMRETLAKHLSKDNDEGHSARALLDRAMVAYALELPGMAQPGNFHVQFDLLFNGASPAIAESLAKRLKQLFDGREAMGTAIALLDASASQVHGLKARDAGVHYTPMPVARFICRQAIGSYILHNVNETSTKYVTIDEFFNSASLEKLHSLYFTVLKDIKIFDSSCGSGVFLEAALDELYRIKSAVLGRADMRSTYDDIDRESRLSECMLKKYIIENNLYGMDVEPYSVEVASLRMMLLGSGSMIQPNLSSDNALFTGLPAAGPFDIIVGNPPYMRVKSMFADSEKLEGIKLKKELADRIHATGFYRYQEGNFNLYKLFLERNISFLHAGGSMGLIIPSSFLNEATSEKLRKHLFDTCSIEQIVEIPERSRIFKGVNQGTAILVFNKSASGDGLFTIKLGTGIGDLDRSDNSIFVGYKELDALTDGRMEVPLLHQPSLEWGMMDRLKNIPQFKGCKGVPPVGEIYIGHVDETIDKAYVSEMPTGDIFIKGVHLQEYSVDLSPEGKQPRWVKKNDLIHKRPSTLSVIDRWRIIGRNTQNKACARRLKFALLPPGYVCGNSIKQILVTDDNIHPLYLLGLLNSSALNWYFEMFCSQNNIRNYNIEALPIVRAPENVQRAIARVAELIIRSTGDERQFLDRELMDSMVYELYFMGDNRLADVLNDKQKIDDIGTIKSITSERIREISAEERFQLIKKATYKIRD